MIEIKISRYLNMKRVKNGNKPNCPVCGQTFGGSLSRPAEPLYCRKETCAYHYRFVKCPKCNASGYDNLQTEVAVWSGPPRKEGSEGTGHYNYQCCSCGKSSEIITDMY